MANYSLAQESKKSTGDFFRPVGDDKVDKIDIA
jgi:hypothetical protein